MVATTTVGTTMSDYLDRTLRLGYVKSSMMLFCGVLVVLFVWHRSTGRIEFEHIVTRPNEIFYWVTILVSNTLGTALGDFVATTTRVGFERGAGVRRPARARGPRAPPDQDLTKSHAEGGLGLARIASSLVIAAGIVAGVVLISRWEGREPKPDRSA